MTESVSEYQVIPEYMPPYPGKNTTPSCVVYHSITDSFLRFENGEGGFRSAFSSSGDYFWDVYGTDFKTVDKAMEALNNALNSNSKPLRKPYYEFVIKLPSKV